MIKHIHKKLWAVKPSTRSTRSHRHCQEIVKLCLKKSWGSLSVHFNWIPLVCLCVGELFKHIKAYSDVGLSKKWWIPQNHPKSPHITIFLTTVWVQHDVLRSSKRILRDPILKHTQMIGLLIAPWKPGARRPGWAAGTGRGSSDFRWWRSFFATQINVFWSGYQSISIIIYPHLGNQG